MTDEAPSTTYVVWWAIMICMAVLLCYRCWQSTQDAEADMHAMRHRHDLLIDVRDTFVEQGEAEWDCPVCGFDNLPRRQACALCSTPQHSVLAISKLTRQSEMSGYFFDDGRSFADGGGSEYGGSRPGSRFANLSSYNTPPLGGSAGRGGGGLESFAEGEEDSWAQSSKGGSAAAAAKQPPDAPGAAREGQRTSGDGGAAAAAAAAPGDAARGSIGSSVGSNGSGAALAPPLDIFTPTTRERSFRVRRLNALSMRQKGAARRKQWVRTQGADGLVRWERAKDAREEARKQKRLVRARLMGGGEAGGLGGGGGGGGGGGTKRVGGGWPWARGGARGVSGPLAPAGAYASLNDDGTAGASLPQPSSTADQHRRVSSVGVGGSARAAAVAQFARNASSSLLAQNAEVVAARNAVRASEGYAPPPPGSSAAAAMSSGGGGGAAAASAAHKRAVSGPLYFGQGASIQSKVNVGELSTEMRLTFVCMPDSDSHLLDRAAGQARRKKMTEAELMGSAEAEAAAAAAMRTEQEDEERRAAHEALSRTIPGGKQLSPLSGRQLVALRPHSAAMPASSLQYQEYDLEGVAAMPYLEKWRWLHERLQDMQLPWAEGHVCVSVRRASMLQDSTDQVGSPCPPFGARSAPLHFALCSLHFALCSLRRPAAWLACSLAHSLTHSLPRARSLTRTPLRSLCPPRSLSLLLLLLLLLLLRRLLLLLARSCCPTASRLRTSTGRSASSSAASPGSTPAGWSASGSSA